MQMDCFVGTDAGGGIFVVDSFEPQSGKFDEHKVFFQFGDATQVMRDFRQYYSGGLRSDVPGYLGSPPGRRIGWASPISSADLQAWLDTGDLTQPYRPLEDVQYT